MDKKIRIMVADDQSETRALVKRYMSFTEDMEIIAEADGGEDVLSQLEDIEVDVILMDINMPGMNGLQATEIIAERFPDIVVIMMSVQGEVEYFKHAMRSGAREFIVKPFELEVLTGTIRDTYEAECKRSVNRVKAVVEPTSSALGHTMAFFGSKGGVGKSVIAVNTAIVLAQQGYKTALIDLDLQFGDVGMLMDIRPKRSIAELVMDTDMALPRIIEHMEQYEDNLHVLLAPKKPEQAEVVHDRHVRACIEEMQTYFDFIVLDLGTNYHENTLAAMDMSDRIYFLTTLDMLSVKNAKLGLDVMMSLDYDKDKIQLVLNRWKAGSKIKPGDIERVLGFKVAYQIEEEKKFLLETINRGEPFAQNKRLRSTRFYKGLKALSDAAIAGGVSHVTAS